MNREYWDDLVLEHGGHPLQLWAWGEIKEKNGAWTATRISVQDGDKIIGGAQILTRKLPPPFGKMHYIPRGPFCKAQYREKVLSELAQWGKEQKGVVLKIEPGWLNHKNILHMKPWKMSSNRILLAKTMAVDLTQSEDDIFNNMNCKVRQDIRRSTREGVTMRLATEKDLHTIMKIYHETAKRAGFNLHSDEYYADIFHKMGEYDRLYIAEREGRILSFTWVVATPEVAFELYGGMNDEGRKHRANYSLKWLAMRAEKERGTKLYDMNGLLQGGVSDFKRGFAPNETDWVGTYDLPLSPLYVLWEKVLPTAKKILHRIQRRK